MIKEVYSPTIIAYLRTYGVYELEQVCNKETGKCYFTYEDSEEFKNVIDSYYKDTKLKNLKNEEKNVWMTFKKMLGTWKGI